jgi:hypothetical protein
MWSARLDCGTCPTGRYLHNTFFVLNSDAIAHK